MSTRYLTTAQILFLHERLIATTGGSPGTRDLGRVESAVAQAKASFDGVELYPDLIAKASAVCFSLVCGHGFVDGNKRVGHAAMEVFLELNGCLLDAGVDEQEQVILSLAAGSLSREELETWLRSHVRRQEPG